MHTYNNEVEDPSSGPSFADEASLGYSLPSQLARSEDLTYLAESDRLAEGFCPQEGTKAAKLFERFARALHRRHNHHVMVTGERGVGKSTIVRQLAGKATREIGFLKHKRFLHVDCRNTMPAERGEKLQAVLGYLADHDDLVVCLDGLGELLQGARSEKNLLIFRSALAEARFQLIAELSNYEYEELLSGEAELLEQFTRVEVEEPEPNVALQILSHAAGELEGEYELTIDPRATRRAVVLSANYIFHDRLPAKAIKLLRAACERVDYDRCELDSEQCCVTADAVICVAAEVTGVPEKTLRGLADETDYAAALGEAIFGQETAVEAMGTELSLIKAGLNDPGKPASVVMFVGQTGTGKTELGKALARLYSTSKKLQTYTMGNFVEPHSVSGLIGVPPGYVGHEQGGRLVNDLNADPYSVVLLDEIDKAHPDVLQPLLNLFDEGWIRDQRGRKGYGNRAIFVMTTNVGQKMISDMVKKGQSMEAITERMKGALSQIRHNKANRPVFSPEFLARIGRVIVFNPLDRQAMEAICRRQIQQMQVVWRESRERTLVVPEALIEYIGRRADEVNRKAEGREGGRIVRKLISDLIESQIQRAASVRTEEYVSCKSVEIVCDVESPIDTESEKAAPEVTVAFQA